MMRKMSKDEINYNNCYDKDGTISHDNTISDDGTCVLKKDFNSYQVKCIIQLQNVRCFLKKPAGIEKNLERNNTKKEYDEKYERLSNQPAKENLFSKNKIKSKD